MRKIPLSRLVAALINAGHNPPGYRKIPALAIDGRLPAEFIGGRWFYQETDFQAIVGSLGL